ncbi:MAG TPA: AAA family ATPase [bacterium]|jgi:DNA polymerase-3 subunit delta'|nr:AAA family ATPase [bacterium]HOG38179.1 AAA family ATPase [bacterium]HQI03231.1 AAA family ATPase [bacterium]
MKEDKFLYNWNVLGHENIIKHLQKILKTKNFLNTYLFSGPEDVGKKTIAKYFIQSIFCKDQESIPCNKCGDCLELKNGIHPDLIQVSLLENKRDIGIDQVRDFREKFSLTPMRSQFKVGIINGADRLSQESSNALLKIIEEPPKNSFVILIAQDVDKILPTIKSRSQNIIFGGVKQKEIYDYLLNNGADKNLSFELSKFSGGAPGVAIAYLKNPKEWERRKQDLYDTVEIIDSSINDKFKWVEKLVNKSKSADSYNILSKTLIDFMRIGRDICVLKTDEHAELIHVFLQDKIRDIAHKYKMEQFLEFYNFANKSRNIIYNNINPKLIFENLLII